MFHFAILIMLSPVWVAVFSICFYFAVVRRFNLSRKLFMLAVVCGLVGSLISAALAIKYLMFLHNFERPAGLPDHIINQHQGKNPYMPDPLRHEEK
jgi:hypothetical protein